MFVDEIKSSGVLLAAAHFAAHEVVATRALLLRHSDKRTTERQHARAMQEHAHDRARRAVRVDQSAGLPERLDALWDAWVSAFPSVEASLRVAKVFEIERHRDVVWVRSSATRMGHTGTLPAVPLAERVSYRYFTGMKHDELLERIETRVSPEDRERIGAAARARHESVAKFVSRAALKEADEVLGREVDVTRMPVEQFHELLSALDQPAHVLPALARLATRERVALRR